MYTDLVNGEKVVVDVAITVVASTMTVGGVIDDSVNSYNITKSGRFQRWQEEKGKI